MISVYSGRLGIFFAFKCLNFQKISCVLFSVGLMRRSCRGLWDTFMYQAVIKSRARVPARDSFVARRIAGPGLASNYFLQVSFV